MKAGEGLKRVDGRNDSELRPVRIAAGASPYAEGSAEVQLGSTKLLITASVEQVSAGAPDGGRIYAGLNMLPRAMHVRIKDAELAEVVKQELQSLQHLLVRSLRTTVKPQDIAAISVTLDCAILCSDAGIGSAVIAGGWVALYQALRWAAVNKLIKDDVYITRIAAVSGGIIGSRILVDLCAEEAAQADFTASFVFDEHVHLVDIRGVCEARAVEPAVYTALLASVSTQIPAILKEQERAVMGLP